MKRPGRVSIPPRGEVLRGRGMLLSFDVDCGELISGHRFVARGLAGPHQLPIPDEWDGDEHEYEAMTRFLDAGGYPGFSLEYELVPGVPPGNDFFHYLVGISYSADAELPWEPQDGGVIAPFTGGATTHGSRGDWPLPPEAKVLTFALFPVTEAGFQAEEPAGALTVDLPRRDATWHSARGRP